MSNPSTYPTIAIIGKHGDTPATDELHQLADFLEARGHALVFEVSTARDLGRPAAQAMTPEQIGAVAQLAIVVGGDGTMLGIARELAPHNLPLVGINQGRLGFITDVRAVDWSEALGPIIQGDYEEERRAMI